MDIYILGSVPVDHARERAWHLTKRF